MSNRRQDGEMESRLGRSALATIVAALAALAFVGYGLWRIDHGSPSDRAGWAVGLVLSAMFLAPVIALLLINAPKFIKESRAARASKIEGVAMNGFDIAARRVGAGAWFDATAAAKALGEDPKIWPLYFGRLGKEHLIREAGVVWASREALAWRAGLDGELGVRRLRKRMESDAFAAYDREDEKAKQWSQLHGEIEMRQAKKASDEALNRKGEFSDEGSDPWGSRG